MKRVAFGCVLALCAALVPVAGYADPIPVERIDTMVRMSDGVRLDVTISIPLVAYPDGGFPLIVRQHGGGSSKDSQYDVRYAMKAVQTGRFALLMYSHRGHGNSEGLFDFFGERSAKDVSELLDFVDAKIDEIDTDRVGMWGYSQGGGLSLLPAETDPRIKAVAVGNTFDDLNHALNPNDCYKSSFAVGIFALAYKSSASKTDDTIAGRWGAQWFTDTEDVALPVVGSTTDEAYAHSPAAHVTPTPGTVYDTGLNVPVFWSNSWEDSLFPADHGSSILAGLQAREIPTHQWFASGGHEVPETDAADEAGKEKAMLEWFEEFLLGVDHGYASGARSRVDYAQRIPGGGWTHKTAAAWPIPGEWTFDAPVASLGTIINTAASANLATEPILANRAGPLVANIPDSPNPLDTLTIAADPFASPLEFTGAPHVRIAYETTATRVAQFNVKIWDESAGARTLVARGCLSDETPADGIAAFDLWPNSHIFPAGHRMVVTVSTVDLPTFKPDPEPQSSTLNSVSVTLPGSP